MNPLESWMFSLQGNPTSSLEETGFFYRFLAKIKLIFPQCFLVKICFWNVKGSDGGKVNYQNLHEILRKAECNSSCVSLWHIYDLYLYMSIYHTTSLPNLGTLCRYSFYTDASCVHCSFTWVPCFLKRTYLFYDCS